MTFTYTNAPASVARDEVRFLVGDTDTTDQLITDEEIAYLITERGSNLGAAIGACEAIEAKFARLADRSFDDISVKASQKAAGFRALAKSLRARMTRTVTPFMGGTSVSDIDSREADTDRPVPAFARGLHEREAS